MPTRESDKARARFLAGRTQSQASAPVDQDSRSAADILNSGITTEAPDVVPPSSGWGADVTKSSILKAASATKKVGRAALGLVGMQDSDAARSLDQQIESHDISAQDYEQRAASPIAQTISDMGWTGFGSVPGGLGLGAAGLAGKALGMAAPAAARLAPGLAGSALKALQGMPTTARFAPWIGQMAAEGVAYEGAYKGSQGEEATVNDLGLAAGANVLLPAALKGIGKVGSKILGLNPTKAIPFTRDVPGTGYKQLQPGFDQLAKDLEAEGMLVTNTFRSSAQNQARGRTWLSGSEVGLHVDAVPGNGNFKAARAKVEALAKKYGVRVLEHGKGDNLHFDLQPSPHLFSLDKQGNMLFKGKRSFDMPVAKGAKAPVDPLEAEKQAKASEPVGPGADEAHATRMADMDAAIAKHAEAGRIEDALALSVERDMAAKAYERSKPVEVTATDVPTDQTQAPERAPIPTAPEPAGIVPVEPGKQPLPLEMTPDAPPTQALTPDPQQPLPGMSPAREPYTLAPELPKDMASRKIMASGRPVTFTDDVDHALYVASSLAKGTPD